MPVALDQAGFYGTTDGGHTWTVAVPLPIFKDEDIPIDYGDLLFSDPLHGWLDAQVVIYATTDGGAHWAELPHP